MDRDVPYYVCKQQSTIAWLCRYGLHNAAEAVGCFLGPEIGCRLIDELMLAPAAKEGRVSTVQRTLGGKIVEWPLNGDAVDEVPCQYGRTKQTHDNKVTRVNAIHEVNNRRLRNCRQPLWLLDLSSLLPNTLLKEWVRVRKFTI